MLILSAYLGINFPWSHFPGHSRSSIINLGRCVDASPTSSYPPVFVPAFIPGCIILRTEFTRGCGCSQHLWKEPECLWLCRDLYTFTDRLFLNQCHPGKEKCILWLKETLRFSDILCSHHNLAEEKTMTWFDGGSDVRSVLLMSPANSVNVLRSEIYLTSAIFFLMPVTPITRKYCCCIYCFWYYTKERAWVWWKEKSCWWTSVGPTFWLLYSWGFATHRFSRMFR